MRNSCFNIIALLGLCLFFWGEAQAKQKLQRMGIFPTNSEIPPQNALAYFDSLTQKGTFRDSIQVSSHHHYLVYDVPLFSKQTQKIIEVPDFQINYLKIYAFKENSIEPIPVLTFGDEFPITQWTHDNRTCNAIFNFEPNTQYKFVVYYSRPGNRPQIQINMHEPEDYVKYWSSLELKFGFIYGLIFIYLVLSILLWTYSRDKRYFYLALWIFVYFSYNFITSGHLKYFFNVDMNGQYSVLRVTMSFLGVYAMNAFSLIHYNRKKELWFVSLFWDLFLLLAVVTISYNCITGENVFLGIEQEFIYMLRALVFVLIVIQIYLPYSHYKRFKEITYLSYVWIFSGINFFVYIYQTVLLEELDFNVYIFYSIWFLIFEIVVIALGISIFTVRERKKRIEMVQKNAILQRDARVLQFEVQERERKRIASELHDDILNRLSVSLLLFRDKFVDVKAFKKTLLTIAEDITSYTHGIYPVLTDSNSIKDLIDQNIRPLAESKGLTLEFDSTKLSFEPNAFTQLHVFRLIQEFVKNAVSHGEATYVQIKLEHDINTLNLFLSDNGQGYDLENTLPGLGTESARNRVQILGGALQIFSESGKGVQWNLTLPQN